MKTSGFRRTENGRREDGVDPFSVFRPPFSGQRIDVFLATAEVAVERALEVGLGAGEFEHADVLRFRSVVRVEAAVEEHPPARDVAAVAFAAVERVLDRAVDEAELAVDFRDRARAPDLTAAR